jgi:hypothetical protein
MNDHSPSRNFVPTLAAPIIPAGYALVRAIPTDEMLAAACARGFPMDSMTKRMREQVRHQIERAIHASPVFEPVEMDEDHLFEDRLAVLFAEAINWGAANHSSIIAGKKGFALTCEQVRDLVRKARSTVPGTLAEVDVKSFPVIEEPETEQA